MVDLEKLKERMKESGMTMVHMANKSGIVRETLYNRLNGKGEFTASEMMALSKVLNLPNEDRDRIFFAQEDECNSTIQTR